MAKKTNSKAKFDMYETVTKRILEQLEQGEIPWLKPWTGGNGAWSRATGKNYSLVNQFMLPHGEYITYTELMEQGGDFIYDENGKRPPAKYVWSFWYNAVKRGDKVNEETGEVEPDIVLLPKAKYYKVYNVEHDTTLDVKYKRDSMPDRGAEAIAELEAIRADYVKRSGVKYDEQLSNRAYYSPAWDCVVVPHRKQFEDSAEFYSTVFHELGHSTGAPKRLNRFKINDKDAAFGSQSYSREELVAELTACSILANTGVETKTSFRNNAAYIQGWSKKLKEDKEAIIRAAAKAEAAYKLIMGMEDEDEKPADGDKAGKAEEPKFKPIKCLAELKRAFAAKNKFVMVEHFVKPEMAGQVRVPNIIQGNAIYSVVDGEPDHAVSKANGGMGYRLEYGKAKDWTFENGLCTCHNSKGDKLFTLGVMEA